MMCLILWFIMKSSECHPDPHVHLLPYVVATPDIKWKLHGIYCLLCSEIEMQQIFGLSAEYQAHYLAFA